MADSRPNILIIQCDQLAQKAVGAYGNDRVRTPHMDRIAAGGVRFDKAYTMCPLCLPARAAMWSGRLPHETGVLSNGKLDPHTRAPADMPTLGSLFSGAAYRCMHFGKTHDGGSLLGFEHVRHEPVKIDGPAEFPYNGDTFTDVGVLPHILGFVKAPPADRPWLAVADLVNPHNICGFVGANQGPELRLPVPDGLPPLPENFEDADIKRRPVPVQYVCCAHRRQAQAAQWPPEKFRHYLAAYYHYTVLVDGMIGRILDALEASGAAGDTMIVFTADHGDAMGAHRLVTKHTTFYEETTRIPLIFAGAGVTGRGRAAGDPLASHLDFLPTLCAAAGIEPREGLRGKSLLAPLAGRAMAEPHPYVVSEWYTEWATTVEPGRMLRTGRYKYTRYVEGDGEELFDLEADPGETRTLVDDPAHAETLAEHRSLLERHVEATGDPFFTLKPKADPRWRSHAPGVHNHRGPSAPVAMGVAR